MRKWSTLILPVLPNSSTGVPAQNITKMEELKAEIIGTEKAPVVVLFGGSPYRRDEVVRDLSQIGDITIYGTLGEEEGFAKIEELDRKVDLILIGGRYDDEQRKRIAAFVKADMPNTKLTQPGIDYPYEVVTIRENVRKLVGL